MPPAIAPIMVFFPMMEPDLSSDEIRHKSRGTPISEDVGLLSVICTQAIGRISREQGVFL